MIREDLRRCPFCDGRANLWKWNGGVRIDCENWRDNHFVGIGARTEEQAVRLWNGNKEEEHG